MTTTQPNPTKCNWTVGCGCPLLRSVQLPVALLSKIFENHYKTCCNQLQPVFYSIYILSCICMYTYTANKKKELIKVIIITSYLYLCAVGQAWGKAVVWWVLIYPVAVHGPCSHICVPKNKSGTICLTFPQPPPPPHQQHHVITLSTPTTMQTNEHNAGSPNDAIPSFGQGMFV